MKDYYNPNTNVVLKPLTKIYDLHLFLDKHFGDKVDKAGKPYKEHLNFVANKAVEYLRTKQTLIQKDMLDNIYIIGLLHDILEDTDVTVAQLLEEYDFCNVTIINSITSLTKHKDESYIDYCHRIIHGKTYDGYLLNDIEHFLVKTIKACDLLHNTQIKRLIEIPKDQREKIILKYLEILPEFIDTIEILKLRRKLTYNLTILYFYIVR